MKKIHINVNNDDSNLNDFLSIYDFIGKVPSKILIHDTFSGKDFEDKINGLISNQDILENSVTELIPNDPKYLVNQKILKKIGEYIWCSYVSIDSQSENFLINDVTFYFKDSSQINEINRIIEILSDIIVNYDDINKLNTISLLNNTLEIDPINLSDDDDIKIDLKYNNKIIKNIHNLSELINNNNKGVSIFYGDVGTGKTQIVKYLTSLIDRISIFIPNNMIEFTINNPEFKNFIKKFDKCLIIIDDCEFLTNIHFSKLNIFTNNIIQLTDSILSDNLNLHLLLIFNECNIDDIDESIIDCNSIIDIIEFDVLTPKKATKLSKKLGYNKKYKEDTRLVDVYKNQNFDKKEKIGL